MSVGHPLTSIAAGRRLLAPTVSIRQMLWPSDRSGTQRARDRLLRRSFRARHWPAHVQVSAGLACSWLAAGDRDSPSVLARMWHVSFRRAQRPSDGLCWVPLWSGAVARPSPREEEHCQALLDRSISSVSANEWYWLARAAAHLSWEPSSVGVRWCPLQAMAMVTQSGAYHQLRIG